jgi:hypothetical protein
MASAGIFASNVSMTTVYAQGCAQGTHFGGISDCPAVPGQSYPVRLAHGRSLGERPCHHANGPGIHYAAGTFRIVPLRLRTSWSMPASIPSPAAGRILAPDRRRSARSRRALCPRAKFRRLLTRAAVRLCHDPAGRTGRTTGTFMPGCGKQPCRVTFPDDTPARCGPRVECDGSTLP